jgi:hypothetical protein
VITCNKSILEEAFFVAQTMHSTSIIAAANKYVIPVRLL